MAETTLILGLEGQVWLTDFTSALAHFQELVEEICEYINREAVVHWEVAGLHAGSAITTIRGASLDGAFLAQVSQMYLAIGHSMQRGQTIPYPPAIAYAAAQLTQVLNERITAVRLETAEGSTTIETPVPSPGRPGRVLSYGEIRGTVETLRRRRNLFTLYEDLFDHGVRCHLRTEQQELMRPLWGKEVVVTGEIERDAATFRVVEIREIDDIQRLQSPPPGSYERARGIMKFGSERPSVLQESYCLACVGSASCTLSTNINS